MDEDYRPEKDDRPDNDSDADTAQETREEGGGEREENQELHLKLLLSSVTSVQGHICGSDR